jgi:hypothetical protein
MPKNKKRHGLARYDLDGIITEISTHRRNFNLNNGASSLMPGYLGMFGWFVRHTGTLSSNVANRSRNFRRLFLKVAVLAVFGIDRHVGGIEMLGNANISL